MYALIVGAIVNAITGYILIPKFDISGAAISTTLATFVLMVMTLYELVRLTGINPPYKDLIKLFFATIVMIIIMYLIPKTILGMIIGGIIGIIVYIVIVVFTKAIKEEDVAFIEHFVNKTGPLKKYLLKIVERIKIYLKE